MSPPILIFLTTIASQPALRQRQEYLMRILQTKKIPYKSYDLASDPDAKRLWKRKAPIDKQQLPGILVGYQFVGTFAQFEEAVEYNELDQFLKLKEPWDPAVDEERPPPVERPVGVPGAQTPMQMTPDHIKKHIIAEQQSPLRIKNKGQKPVNKEDDSGKIDLGSELAGYGLQGVKVTEEELDDLMKQLGLDGDDAADLAKGLDFNTDVKKDSKKAGASSSKPTTTSPLAAAPLKVKKPEVKEQEPEVNEKEKEPEVQESVPEAQEKGPAAAEPNPEAREKEPATQEQEVDSQEKVGIAETPINATTKE